MVGIGNYLDKKRLLRFSGNNRGESRVTSFEHQGTLIKTEPGFLLFLGMAFEAVVDKDGGDVVREGNLAVKRVGQKEDDEKGESD